MNYVARPAGAGHKPLAVTETEKKVMSTQYSTPYFAAERDHAPE